MGAIREMITAHGADHVVEVFVQALVEGKLDPMRVSMREVWEETVGPVAQTLTYAARANQLGLIREAAVDSSAFSTMMGSLIAKTVIDAYEAEPKIGEQLVTTIPSKQRAEKVTGFTAHDGLLTVEEGADYQEAGFGEKWVTTQDSKKGRLLFLTEETVFFDKTGQMLTRARSMGERAAQEKEKVIVNTVQDLAGYLSYYPSGTQTTFYSGGHSNVKTSNALVDWTDCDAVFQVMVAQTDEKGERISVVPKILLTPMSLSAAAWYIVHATAVAFDSNRTAELPADKRTAPNLPRVRGLIPLSSYLLDANSTSTWYMGDFKRDIIYREIWPIQTLQGRFPELAFRKDVVAAFKARMYGGCNAIDYRHSYRSTA